MTEFFNLDEKPEVLEPEVLPEEEKVTFDIVRVETDFKKYMVQLDDMVSQATSHEVTDQASNERSIEMIGQAKKLFAQLDNQRLEFVKPFKSFTQKVDGLVRPYKSKLTDIVQGLQRKSGKWMQVEKEKERKAREAEMKKRAEQMQTTEELDVPAGWEEGDEEKENVRAHEDLKRTEEDKEDNVVDASASSRSRSLPRLRPARASLTFTPLSESNRTLCR